MRSSCLLNQDTQGDFLLGGPSGQVCFPLSVLIYSAESPEFVHIVMGSIETAEVPEYLCGERQWNSSQNTELYDAAANGDIRRLRDALEKGANPNYFNRNDDGTPGVLHAAAKAELLSNKDNEAALCAKELIGKGARVSAALISNRNAPIHEAAFAGSKGVCEVLIEASPKCTKSENSFGNTALHAASRSGSVDVVRLLLEKGADSNKTNHRGSTALHIACFLASNGKEGGTMPTDPYLNIAAILLCDNALDVDTKDVNGYTALHIAAQRGCNDMVRLLIDSGASLTAKTYIDSKGRGGRTPAGMAKFGGQETTMSIIEEAVAAIENGEGIGAKTMARDLDSACR